ncbi:MAG: glycosyltransferase family 4 protein [Pseudomonadota bacterium]
MSNLPRLDGRTILQVIPEIAAGGAERTVIEVAEAVQEAGGKALVASAGGRLAPQLDACGGELITMDLASKNPLVVFQNASRLAQLISSRSVDLVHARSRAPAWSAWRAAHAAGIPFVTTYHGAYSGTSGPKKLYNSVMARGDLVIANSEWICDHIKTVHGVQDDKIVVIPRGVDLTRFNPSNVSESRMADMRRDWGLSDKNTRLVLLLPARFTEWKGQSLALSALARLAPDERDALVLVMAGDAQGRRKYLEELETQIAENDLLEATRVAGHCTDMPAALASADIVLAPSVRPEAFGRTAIEAAAMGKSVIAADHGGARETVIDGQTGARFQPGDAAALAGAIRSLVQIGPETRQGMGLAGRIHVERHYSKRGLQAATLSVYTALMTKGISRTA